jgi:hypothetical protein
MISNFFSSIECRFLPVRKHTCRPHPTLHPFTPYPELTHGAPIFLDIVMAASASVPMPTAGRRLCSLGFITRGSEHLPLHVLSFSFILSICTRRYWTGTSSMHLAPQYTFLYLHRSMLTDTHCFTCAQFFVHLFVWTQDWTPPVQEIAAVGRPFVDKTLASVARLHLLRSQSTNFATTKVFDQ